MVRDPLLDLQLQMLKQPEPQPTTTCFTLPRTVSATKTTMNSVAAGEPTLLTLIALINTPTVETWQLTVVETLICPATAALLAKFTMPLQLASIRTTLTAQDTDWFSTPISPDLVFTTMLTPLLHHTYPLLSFALKPMVPSDAAWNATLHATATLEWNAALESAKIKSQEAPTLDLLVMLGNMNTVLKKKTEGTPVENNAPPQTTAMLICSAAPTGVSVWTLQLPALKVPTVEILLHLQLTLPLPHQ